MMLESFLEFSLIASAPEASPWWRFFGRLHPLLLHFPIAMLIAAGSVELFMSWRRGARPCSIASFCLWVGATFAVLATWTGWEMAEFEDIASNPVKADLLEWHRWTGVVLAVLTILICIVWLIERISARRWAFNTYRCGLWSSAILVCFVGHFGAEMKWGRDYLFSVLRTKAAPVSDEVDPPSKSSNSEEPSEESLEPPPILVSWSNQIEPMLDSRCGDCHGPDAQKGGLQLVPYEAFRGHLDIIDQTSPMKSLLIHRVVLPASDPDAMPPSGDRLTGQQVQELAEWIEQGGSGPTHEAVPMPAGTPDVPETSSPTKEASFSSLEEQSASPLDSPGQLEAMAAIGTMGGFVAPISQRSSWLDVNLSLIRPAVDDAQIKLLEQLKQTIIWLNLGDTAITDEGVGQTVAWLKSLRRLRLDRTRITDEGVSHLAGLEKLEILNLFGTRVGDGCLVTIEHMPSLQTVYLWDTKVTKAGLDRLRSVRPDLNLVVGDESSENSTRSMIRDDSRGASDGA